MNRKCLVLSVRTFTRTVVLQNLRTKYSQLPLLVTHQHATLCPARHRLFSEGPQGLREISFDELKKLRNKNAVIIDVREPEELKEHGTIPGSINIPLGEIKEALRNLSDEDFLKKYGASKPHESDIIIFSCRAGNRSRQAQELAVQLGFQKVMNYSGGWTDWTIKSNS